MGEFTGTNLNLYNANRDMNTASGRTDTNQEAPETGYPTDVEGVSSDGQIEKGTDKFPVFKVTPQEFWSNQKASRKKIRFKNGSAAQQYSTKSKYARTFYIETSDSKGVKYRRKIR